MQLIYADNEPPFTGRPTPYNQQDAVRHWARHYANFKFLSFVAERSTDRIEVQRARAELLICSKKMMHWQRHVNWTAQEGARARAAEDRKWEEGRR